MEPRSTPRAFSIWPDLVLVWLLGFAWPTTAAMVSLFQGRTLVVLTDRRLLFSMLVEAFSLGAMAIYWRSRGRLKEMATLKPTWGGTGMGLLLALAAWVSYFLTAWGIILLSGNPGVLGAVKVVNQTTVPVAALMCLVNPIFEEVLVAGCVIRILEEHGAQVALGISVLIRLAYHLYQGPLAVASILPTGFLFGAYFWKTRDVWPLIFAHAVLDFAALALLK